MDYIYRESNIIVVSMGADPLTAVVPAVFSKHDNVVCLSVCDAVHCG